MSAQCCVSFRAVMTCLYMKRRNGLKRLICKTFQVKNENGKLDESKKDIE